jgi:hypothetical protein
MRTVSQLQSDFGVYFLEMENCEMTGCLWALLHLVLVMPDVCASLEDPARGITERYTDWCGRYLKSSALNHLDWFQMRNALFHQGSTTAGTKNPKNASQYTHFSFIDPTSTVPHESRDRGIIWLQIPNLTSEMKRAVNDWFADLQHKPSLMAVVEQNIHLLARAQVARPTVVLPQGSVTTVEAPTTSST